MSLDEYHPSVREIVRFILKETGVKIPTKIIVSRCIKDVNGFGLGIQQDACEFFHSTVEYNGRVGNPFCMFKVTNFKLCTECQRQSTMKDDTMSFFEITAPFFIVPSSVQAALDAMVNLPSDVLAFKAPDLVDGYSCEFCVVGTNNKDIKQKVTTIMEDYVLFDMDRCPVIIFHLFLFTTEGVHDTFKTTKLFPLEYTIDLSVNIHGEKYDLINVIFHEGESIEQGHYTNLSKMSCENSHGHRWFVLDDHKRPVMISEDAECKITDPSARMKDDILSRLGDPYILAYARAPELDEI